MARPRSATSRTACAASGGRQPARPRPSPDQHRRRRRRLDELARGPGRGPPARQRSERPTTSSPAPLGERDHALRGRGWRAAARPRRPPCRWTISEASASRRLASRPSRRLVGGGADQPQRRAGRARHPRTELERRPVVPRGAERDHHRPRAQRAAGRRRASPRRTAPASSTHPGLAAERPRGGASTSSRSTSSLGRQAHHVVPARTATRTPPSAPRPRGEQRLARARRAPPSRRRARPVCHDARDDQLARRLRRRPAAPRAAAARRAPPSLTRHDQQRPLRSPAASAARRCRRLSASSSAGSWRRIACSSRRSVLARLEPELARRARAGRGGRPRAPRPAGPSGRARASAGSAAARAAGARRSAPPARRSAPHGGRQARSASIRCSSAAQRSSSSRAISAWANGSYARSASGGPRHSASARRSFAAALAGSAAPASATQPLEAREIELGAAPRAARSRATA